MTIKDPFRKATIEAMSLLTTQQLGALIGLEWTDMPKEAWVATKHIMDSKPGDNLREAMQAILDAGQGFRWKGEVPAAIKAQLTLRITAYPEPKPKAKARARKRKGTTSVRG